MKVQTAAFLAGADKALVQAHGILAIDFADQAARLAYYAQFHAAQALVYERTGGVAKTHKGVSVRRLFHKLALAESCLDPGLAGDLTHAYQFKQIADYETGNAATVTSEAATDAIAVAERFVAGVRQALDLPFVPSTPADEP